MSVTRLRFGARREVAVEFVFGRLVRRIGLGGRWRKSIANAGDKSAWLATDSWNSSISSS